MYKNSIFNYVIDLNDEIRLYNSIKGKNSLLIATGSNYTKVKEILCKKNYDYDPQVFKKLYDNGFIINENVNEHLIREQVLNDVINNNKLHLVIMPTEQCNFRCVYCYENHIKGKMSLETQDAIIKYVRNNIKYYTGLNIGWFGGEPLEALDVIKNLSNEFIKICKIARKPFKAGITTNGYNLTKEVFEELHKLHVYEYQISIDGLKSSHDSQRKLVDGSGTFDRIIFNIKEIKRISKLIKSEIIIRTNFTKKIINEIDDYVKFYDDLLKNDDRFSLQVNMAGDWGGEDVKSISHDLLNVDDYIKLFNNLVRIPNSINFSFHLQELTPAEFKCYAAKKNSYTIGSDGRIYKCTEAFDMSENNLGYISKSGEMIIDYYKESCWTSISRTLNIEKCLTCKYSGCCLYSPCPKNSLQSTNKEPVCPRTKGNVVNLIKVLSTECFEKI